MEGLPAIEYTAQMVAQSFLNSLNESLQERARICEVLALGLTNKHTKKFTLFTITVTVEPQIYDKTIYPMATSSVTECLKQLEKSNE